MRLQVYNSSKTVILLCLFFQAASLQAQPGCGKVYLDLSGWIDTSGTGNLKVKAFRATENGRFVRDRHSVFGFSATSLMLGHYEGEMKYILRQRGRKLKLRLSGLQCSVNYLIRQPFTGETLYYTGPASFGYQSLGECPGPCVELFPGSSDPDNTNHILKLQ